MLGDHERAHDAVQETFARALRNRFDFRGERSLEGWLWLTLLLLRSRITSTASR
jgi:DNA-directed RNA polymerase specialized sigma24 family protein